MLFFKERNSWAHIRNFELFLFKKILHFLVSHRRTGWQHFNVRFINERDSWLAVCYFLLPVLYEVFESTHRRRLL